MSRENQQYVAQGLRTAAIMNEHFQQRSSRDPSANRDPSSTRKQPPPTKPKPLTSTKTRSRNEQQTNGSKEQDPIDVYCRIRPLTDQTDLVCAKVVSNNVVRLSNPRSDNGRDLDYTFKNVFCEKADQKDVFQEVAKPLIKDLIDGKNCKFVHFSLPMNVA